MELFHPIVEERRQHKNFASVLVPFRQVERDLFTDWAKGFVDRDGKFVEEFQTTFNSSFWEVYLFASFKEFGFEFDWSNSTPDFCLYGRGVEFVVEATTANSAHDKPNEWDRNFSVEQLKVLKRLKDLNTEAIIRLSNSILSKSLKFEETYKKLEHVKGVVDERR